MEKGKQAVGNDVSSESERAMKMKTLCPYPVEPNSAGEGLPYAPVDWPNPGDTWRWWVGSRTHPLGFHRDRFLYLPKRLRVPGSSSAFGSKSSLKHYVSSQFPNADVEELFASFIWMVPATKRHQSEGED